jgi:hypothetical protein
MNHTMSSVFRLVKFTGLIIIGPTFLVLRAETVNEPAAAQLRVAIARYWEDQLRTHPLEATIFVGDQRGAGHLDDPSLGAFHDCLLSFGSVPLWLLERLMNK